MKSRASRTVLWLLLFALCLVACTRAPSYPIPEQTGDGWETANLDEVGLEASQLLRLIDRVRDGRYQNVHSILVVKENKLVFEEYFEGYAWSYSGEGYRGERVDFGRDTLHNLASVTKSFTSALLGIAMGQGHVAGVEGKLFAFFPDYAHLSDAGKDQITLEHLLTMSSGLAWNETTLPYSDSRNDLVQLFSVPDPKAYILGRPLANPPGSEWDYNGGNTNLLGEVIREATGRRMDDFAAEYLFAPLGIEDYRWDYINPDMIHASGNLRLRPRDMAKFGLLYLNGGTWGNQEIVSPDWVEASTREHVALREGAGYGYQWWLKSYSWASGSAESYQAMGWGGQRIVVFPELDMVVVFTGGNYVDPEPLDEILVEDILPALPENKSGGR